MPRNPSELQRLEEEREDLIRNILWYKKHGRVMVREGGLSDKGHKAQREKLLKDLRAIERQLGIEHVPYNSSKFGEQLK